MSPHKLSEIWVYLAASPLLHLTLTVAAYLLAGIGCAGAALGRCSKKMRGAPNLLGWSLE